MWTRLELAAWLSVCDTLCVEEALHSNPVLRRRHWMSSLAVQ